MATWLKTATEIELHIMVVFICFFFFLYGDQKGTGNEAEAEPNIAGD